MTSTLLIIQFVLAILLTIIILLQKVQALVLELTIEVMIHYLVLKVLLTVNKATMALGLVCYQHSCIRLFIQ